MRSPYTTTTIMTTITFPKQQQQLEKNHLLRFIAQQHQNKKRHFFASTNIGIDIGIVNRFCSKRPVGQQRLTPPPIRSK